MICECDGNLPVVCEMTFKATVSSEVCIFFIFSFRLNKLRSTTSEMYPQIAAVILVFLSCEHAVHSQYWLLSLRFFLSYCCCRRCTETSCIEALNSSNQFVFIQWDTSTHRAREGECKRALWNEILTCDWNFLRWRMKTTTEHRGTRKKMRTVNSTGFDERATPLGQSLKTGDRSNDFFVASSALDLVVYLNG